MRLPFLPYPHPTVVAMHKQHMAVFADLTLVHRWERDFRCHSYFSGSCNVTAGKLRIVTVDAFSFLEENLYSLSGYLLCSGPHVHVAFCSLQYSGYE
jgi:hypothetical protein